EFTLLTLFAIAFSAYSLTPCQDFCQGTVLGFTPWCWWDENFLKLNRTCFQKCVTNCKAKSDYTKCIPSNGIPTTTLWLCCMKKITWATYLKCDGECWSTALPTQLTLLGLFVIAFSAYSLTQCEDFCQGTVLGFTPWCWCNENFLKFNRTCFQKCVTNCKNKTDYTKCIPSNGIPTTTLWLCCMNKITWTTYLKCDGECWSTALPTQLTLLGLFVIAFSAYSLTQCEDFCQGTVLGFTPWCWCNENFLKFNRTCFQKCVTNCKNKTDYTKCIPSNGIPTTTLWLCCMNKITWTTYLKCDGECWSTALP
ncbi:hypothetical protein PMAYCL1PPCAC_11597, partial [Pristionchus mayeri]